MLKNDLWELCWSQYIPQGSFKKYPFTSLLKPGLLFLCQSYSPYRPALYFTSRHTLVPLLLPSHPMQFILFNSKFLRATPCHPISPQLTLSYHIQSYPIVVHPISCSLKPTHAILLHSILFHFILFYPVLDISMDSVKKKGFSSNSPSRSPLRSPQRSSSMAWTGLI